MTCAAENEDPVLHPQQHRKATARDTAGFTLLEMLVAVTLVAIMSIALWAVFRISIRSWSRGTEFMDANQRHRSILNLVRKQMASTYGLLAIDDQQPGAPGTLIFNGKRDSIQFVSLNSLQFQANPGSLWCLTMSIRVPMENMHSWKERRDTWEASLTREFHWAGRERSRFLRISRVACWNTLIRAIKTMLRSGSRSGMGRSSASCRLRYHSRWYPGTRGETR